MEIIKMNARKFFYRRRIGAYGPENQELMENLKAFLYERKLFEDNLEILALIHDDPQTTLPEACRYDVGVVAPFREQLLLQELEYADIPESVFGVFRIAHTSAAIIEVMQTMAEKVAAQGFKINHQMPIIECYRHVDVQNGYCEIHVPLLVRV